MAFIRRRGNKIHIFYNDPLTGKLNSKTTGLEYNSINLKLAKKMLKDISNKIKEEKNKLVVSGINSKDTIKSAFNHFKEINKDKHPKTIEDYERFYKYFSQMFDENTLCVQLNKTNVENWFLKIKELKQKKNSIHGLGRQCIHFLNFLFEYNYTPVFKVNKNVRTRPERVVKITFSDDDIIKIFENLKNKNDNFKTLIYLAFYTGLRSSDLLNIKVERIRLKENILSYYSPKRKIDREIPFHPKLNSIIEKRILEVQTGKLLNYKDADSLGRAVYKYLDVLGLKKKGYSARTFRKTFITLCRNRFRIETPIVQELVGHQQNTIIDQHYNVYDMVTLKSELNKFQPIISPPKLILYKVS